MRMKNYGDDAIRIPADLVVAGRRGTVEVQPGETVDVRGGYGYPRRAPNGARIASVVEGVAKGLEPADDDYRKEWAGVPDKDWSPPQQEPSAAELRARGVSPGVASILAAKQRAQAVTADPVVTAAKVTAATQVATPPPAAPAAPMAAAPTAPAKKKGK